MFRMLFNKSSPTTATNPIESLLYLVIQFYLSNLHLITLIALCSKGFTLLKTINFYRDFNFWDVVLHVLPR